MGSVIKTKRQIMRVSNGDSGIWFFELNDDTKGVTR